MNREDSRAIINVVKSIYYPSVRERKLKAAYWQICREGPSRSHTIENIAELLGEPDLLKKADDQAFIAWFTNEREFQQQLHYLAGLSMGVIEDVLLDGDARPSDRLKAVALVNDLVKASAKVEDTTGTGDKLIDSMSDEELDKFIEQHS